MGIPSPVNTQTFWSNLGQQSSTQMLLSGVPGTSRDHEEPEPDLRTILKAIQRIEDKQTAMEAQQNRVSFIELEGNLAKQGSKTSFVRINIQRFIRYKIVYMKFQRSFVFKCSFCMTAMMWILILWLQQPENVSYYSEQSSFSSVVLLRANFGVQYGN